MNIFYLNNDPKICAEMHLDKHVVKMILEYAQLLSTAHRVLDGEQSPWFTTAAGRKKREWMLYDDRQNILYAATHINHPSAVWVRYSDKNYTWLVCLLNELCKEYTHRYGKIHKCERDGLVKALIQLPKNIQIKNFTEPTPAMPDDVKVLREVETDRFEIDSIKSYHKYYIHNKVHIAKWTKREMPLWYSEGIKNANIQLSKQRNK